MKKNKTKKENKLLKDEKPKTNFWKIFSLIFIGVFLVVVILGLLRLYHFKSSFEKSTSDEAKTAESAIYNYMELNGRNISADRIKAFDRVTRMPFNGSEKKMIGVMVFDNAAEEMFLVDIESNEIMMHSKTEFFGWLNNSRGPPFRNPRFIRDERHR